MNGLIGIDWGSTNLRVFHLGTDGEILDVRTFPFGITKLANTDFGPTLKTVVAELPSNLPIIMCGMIGSAHGWHEVDYLPCPCSIGDLSNNLVDISGLANRECYLIRGVSGLSEGGFVDVMRGEETQIFGVPPTVQICLPGTHCKWVSFANGEIISFSTHLTGELFGLLSSSGLLSKCIQPSPFDSDSFEEGCQLALQGGNLLHQLFSVRSRFVSGSLTSVQTGSYLSGVLIGSELSTQSLSSVVTVVGTSSLAQKYALGLSMLGVESTCYSGETACANGLFAIWKERK